MNTDSLIKIITEEVIKRLSILNQERHQEKAESILILDRVSEKKQDNYEIIKSKWSKTKFLDDYLREDGIDLFDYIIVPNLSNKDLASIAVGNPQSEISQIIIESIFLGKTVIVLEEGICYREFESTANKNFFNMFKAYEEKIVGFGVDVVREEELMAYLDKGACKEEVKDESKPEAIKAQKQEGAEVTQKATISRKLISERDIEKLWNRGYKTISTDKRSIITPLAIDFIRRNEINIIRK
ncbi:hypothetical protein R9X47_22050 [Wukongibacter baidiensis]|uniref:hypothetical protein n=1 Tax=Wukongibacter baidiensis TaxID=1723361 RepID=UPI003D7F4B6D